MSFRPPYLFLREYIQRKRRGKRSKELREEAALKSKALLELE